MINYLFCVQAVARSWFHTDLHLSVYLNFTPGPKLLIRIPDLRWSLEWAGTSPSPSPRSYHAPLYPDKSQTSGWIYLQHQINRESESAPGCHRFASFWNAVFFPSSSTALSMVCRVSCGRSLNRTVAPLVLIPSSSDHWLSPPSHACCAL